MQAAIRAGLRALRTAALWALVLAAGAGAAFDLQGHRGARGLAPENTLAGFRRALAAGVSTLELDVGVTRDGVVVIHHDMGLNPDIARRDGAWVDTGADLVALSHAELRAYDVGRLRPGSATAGRHPAQEPRDGEAVPTLDELFVMLRASGETGVHVNIETKVSPLATQRSVTPEAMVEAVLRVIARHDMGRRASLQSFDWRALAHARRLAPAIPTIHLTARRPGFDTVDPRWNAGHALASHGSVPRLVKAAGGAAWSPHFADLDAATLGEARRLGLRVIPWTVNAPDDMARMIDLGVDGLITDYPDRARALIEARGLTIAPIDWAGQPPGPVLPAPVPSSPPAERR